MKNMKKDYEVKITETAWRSARPMGQDPLKNPRGI